jgi:hypothetical protein
MKICDIELMEAEYQALLEIIRRDYRVESIKSVQATTESDLRCVNARMSIRLLELFNPKRQAVQKAGTMTLCLSFETTQKA